MAWAAQAVRSRELVGRHHLGDEADLVGPLRADIRSLAPSRERRMTSWNGIFWSRKIGSKAAGMP